MLYELVENKMTTMANMHSFGRGVNGESRKQRRRLFA